MILKNMRKQRRRRRCKAKRKSSVAQVVHTYFDDDNDVENSTDAAATDLPREVPEIVSQEVETEILKENFDNIKEHPKKRHRKRQRKDSNKSNGKRQKGDESHASEHAQKNESPSSAALHSESKTPDNADENRDVLTADVKRYLIELLSATPTFIKLSILNREWRSLCKQQAARWSRSGLTVDVARFFRDNNPFVRTIVENSCERPKAFHDEVRKLVRILVKLAEFEPDRNKGSSLKLENFTPKALGWLHSYSEDQLPTCPLILREKIRDLFLLHFNGTSKYIYCEPFFESAMFINMVYHCQDRVTSLDLGDLKGAEKILNCTFPNLEELVWHNADMDDFEGLGFPKLSTLSLTAEASSMIGFNLLRRCPNLSFLFTGLRVPDNPTRFDLDVLLRCYQSFWNTSTSEDDEDDEDIADPKYVLSTLPKLQHVGFWNAPEKLFAIMARCGIGFETLQFGQLNQSLSRLCSLDSIMQALFKFNQPKYDSYNLDVKHLRLYLHAMPVVSLDYYLPQLMMGINDALCSIQSLDLFVHCSFSATMPSSWVLDGRFKNSRSKLKQLTHFSLHMDGFCVFDDLDCHLPPCVTSISISVSLPAMGASKSVASLLEFIKRLANVNAYPDLEELHMQVWGTRCAESLLNRVADHLSDIRRLSIIAMPVDEERDRLIDLIKHVVSSCPRLVSLQLSAEMTRLLVSEYGDLWRNNWRLAIANLRSDCGLRDVCELTVASLPLIHGCDDYVVTPNYPEVSEVNFDAEEDDNDEDEEKSMFSEDDTDSCSNDTFVVHSEEEEEEGSEESEDEIDECERKLEEETERRHERYLRRKAREPSTSSEDPTQEESMEDEDDSDVEYVTDYEDEEGENNVYGNPLIDAEAEEVESGMESSDPSDAEPEGEDIVYSSDREMLEAEAQMVNARPRRKKVQAVKRRHIIESDTD